MFTFTKLPLCVLLALLSIKSVQAAPIDIESIIESVLDNLPEETSALGNLIQTGSVSDIAPSSADDTGTVFTVVTSVGGSAITLGQSGATTVWNGATYTIDADDAAATSVVGNVGEPVNGTDTGSIAFPTDSASASASTSASASVDPASSTTSSASTTTSASLASSSGASAVSSASSSAKSSSSSSSKPNSGTALRPVEFSTPLARGLFTVAVGVVLGAWCL
ncbi:hypothetical protein FB451DRAFT_1211515 [Mycena latifolia]|nr:hypothetical protein FB451DRAFT_1211515 [Mycena latifolia]